MNDKATIMSESIEQKFEDIFQFKPEVKYPLSKDLFSISQYAHYENILSNWYAFFFGNTNEHGFGRLFIDSVITLIKEKGGAISEDFFGSGSSCWREYATKKGKRIDILLYDEEVKDSTYQNSIIIENKVFHHLNNDLEDYYASVNVAEGGSKIGILLSLRKTKSNHAGFINITHSELLKTVLALLPSYWTTAGDKYIMYLRDLHQNIIRLTADTTMDKNIRFYFNNVAKFYELEAIMDQSEKYVHNQIRVAAELLGMVSGGGKEDYTYIYERQADDIYYTILMHDFYKTGKSITVVIELWGKNVIDLLEHFKKECADIEAPGVDMKTNNRGPGDGWLYFAEVTYPLTIDDIENLGDFLYTHIHSDLEPIRKRLLGTYSK